MTDQEPIPRAKSRPRSDVCPHCKLPFDIAAVSFSILKPTCALFVCPACALASPESGERARRKIRERIASLSRKMSALTRAIRRT